MLKDSTEFSSKSVPFFQNITLLNGKEDNHPSKFSKSCMRDKGYLGNAGCTNKGVLRHTSANWEAEIHEPNYSPRLWHGTMLHTNIVVIRSNSIFPITCRQKIGKRRKAKVKHCPLLAMFPWDQKKLHA